jgi:hypothetical protein
MEQLPAIDASGGGQLVLGNICDFLVYITEVDQVMNVQYSRSLTGACAEMLDLSHAGGCIKAKNVFNRASFAMKSSSQCHTLENIIIFPAYILDAIQRA